MKNIILMAFAIGLIVAPVAFASDVTSASEGLTVKADASGGPIIAKLSSNVMADINYLPATYAIATKATKGTRIYGTAADDTSIYAKVGTAKTALAVGDLGDLSDKTAFDSGWTEM